MLSVLTCLFGVFIILVVGELFWRKKVLRYEYYRKFIHMSVGIFAAFWPWLISWHTIQLIGLAMAVTVLIDREVRVFKISWRINRQTYGDLFFALAITISALLTNNKYFFMIAVLHLAIADGMAAIIGQAYGKRWRYKIFGETRSVIGTMAFWISSFLILGFGLLCVLQPNLLTYGLILLVLPPALSVLENLSIRGLDNIVVSAAVITALKFIY